MLVLINSIINPDLKTPQVAMVFLILKVNLIVRPLYTTIHN